MRGASDPPQVCHIAKLPSELLIHIFAFVHDAHNLHRPSYERSVLYPSSTSRRRPNPAITLSHTCSRWSSLTGALWDTLHLDGEIDGTRAEAKASFWAMRARGRGQLPGPAADEAAKATKPARVTTLVLTRVQDWGDEYLAYLGETLDLIEHLRLRRVRVSWMGGGASSADESKQLQSVFRLLLSSASKLEELTLHTLSHLRILFSLPRLGHTFTALRSLEIRSCNMRYHASDAYLIPAFLPGYEGEDDWEPLAHLDRLVLVGPIWRLRFRDGTVASPTLEVGDLPALTHCHLGSTSPPIAWSLLSSETIQHLFLEDHIDHPRLPDPDLTASFATLTSLSMIRSPSLVTRLLDSSVKLSLRFPHLTALNLDSACLSQAHLELFSGEGAPMVAKLELCRTTSTTGRALALPTFPAVTTFSALDAAWLPPYFLQGLNVSMPRLEHLYTDVRFTDEDLAQLPVEVLLHFE
ncbi:hypothetical protein JCM21900_005515 [Sporobolomyces salmonicolor]